MNYPQLGRSGSAAIIPCWKLTRQSSDPACRRRPRRIWAPVRTWMPSVTEAKDEGEAEDANQDLAVPRRGANNEEAARARPPHLSPSFIARVDPKTYPVGPVKRRSRPLNAGRRTPRSTAESGSARQAATARGNVPSSSPSGDRADNA